jgi:hypothetical protein
VHDPFDLQSRPPNVTAALRTWGVVRRVVQLVGEIEADVEWNGRGLGYESVRIDGVTVDRRPSSVWFVPEFEFDLPGGYQGFLEVRVWPWLGVRALRLSVDGHVVYSEGRWPEPATPPRAEAP